MMQLPTWRGWCVLALVAAALAWLAAPGPEPLSVLVKVRRDDWALASLPRRFDQTSMAGTVLSAAYWGAALNASAVSEPIPDPRWRIAAVYGRGTQGGALVVFSDPAKPPQRLAVGDALPSGEKIVRIGEREVCVRIGKKTYRLGVERRDS